MISGQWFYRRFLKNWQKFAYRFTHNSMTNWGSTLFLTDMVVVHQRKIHTKCEANLFKRICMLCNYQEAHLNKLQIRSPGDSLN